MDFHPAPGVLEVAQQFTTPGGSAYNVYHVAHLDSTTWSVSQIAAMLTVFSNWEQATGRLRRTADFDCQQIRARDLSTHFGTEGTIGGNTAGTLAGASLPDNVTLAIKKSTGKAGRAFRGRVYWIGLSVAKQTKDMYDGVEVTAIVTALETLRTSVEAVANCGLAIVHGQIDGVVQNPRPWTQVIGHVATDDTLDSQRRRLLSHNIHR